MTGGAAVALGYNGFMPQTEGYASRVNTRASSRAFILLFALALVLIVCAIGTVAWRCIDSLDKHSDRIKAITSTQHAVAVNITNSELAQQLDQRVMEGNMDPEVALQQPTAHGSEVTYNRGLVNIEKRDFSEAASDFTRTLAMIPVEAVTKHAWHVGADRLDKRLYLASTYEQRARCYMESRHYREALADLNAAIKLRPEYQNNYRNRAKVEQLLRRGF
ncbi:MAG: tetratricopeptide repeat protein [Cyanobacteria bacterium SZAS LIN-3]|nr:tetratricopeptide repeat protein [Cyanobacteria bacterium SZAS LIN-3]MBS2005961.1 tetratricopeptide repeat protein [Cyanobacteria bacterium SZAS TMP-1]